VEASREEELRRSSVNAENATRVIELERNLATLQVITSQQPLCALLTGSMSAVDQLGTWRCIYNMPPHEAFTSEV
jgi:hypothetical protein